MTGRWRSRLLALVASAASLSMTGDLGATSAFPAMRSIGAHCPGWFDASLALVGDVGHDAELRIDGASASERAAFASVRAADARALARLSDRCQAIWSGHDATSRAYEATSYWHAYATAYAYRTELESRRTLAAGIIELDRIGFDSQPTSADRIWRSRIDELRGELTERLEDAAR